MSIDKLKAALRCGAPSTETWHELASRTNAERSEAANRIEELERKLAFTEEMNGIASNLMRNCIECINDQERKLAEAERRQVPVETLKCWLEKMESDWRRIDSEWGPICDEFGDLEGAITRGYEPEIAELRSLIAVAPEKPE